MIDIFISFSTRSTTDISRTAYLLWVTNFRNRLIEVYKSMFARDLTIWDYIGREDRGDNFVHEIAAALSQTTILISILDPGYLGSPQTIDEVVKYRKIRSDTKQDEYFLKVVKYAGEQADQIRDLVDANIVLSNFSAKDAGGREKEFAPDSAEYDDEIRNLVVAIRKAVVAQQLYNAARALMDRMKALKGQDFIYVALGNAVLKEDRIVFINQLGETLRRKENLPKVRILPDDFTLSLIDRETLGRLLMEDNKYREECLQAMLSASRMAVVLLEYNNNNEAEELKRNILFQMGQIKLMALDDQQKKPLNILLNIPENLRATCPFSEDINNPAYIAYENIKIINDQNITAFIGLLIGQLEGSPAGGEAPAGGNPAGKAIYIIENDKGAAQPAGAGAGGAGAGGGGDDQRRLLREELLASQCTLIPAFDNSNDMLEAVRQLKEWLELSDGIIIFRGKTDDEQWCRQKQADTYKALSQLAGKKNLPRAVYVDPGLDKREKTDYAFFNYEVILNNPPELNRFLCRI